MVAIMAVSARLRLPVMKNFIAAKEKLIECGNGGQPGELRP